MNIPVSLLIALNYIKEVKKEKSISIMIKISFISIAICTFALALSIFIMNGFEKATYQNMQSIHPQIIIQSNNANNANSGFLDFNKIDNLIKKEFNQVEYLAPNDFQYALIDYHNAHIGNLVILKGIDPYKESKVSNIEKKIINIKDNFNNLKNNNVIIGQKLAKDLNIRVGNSIYLLIPKKTDTNILKFSKIKILVSGLFNTGIEDFDSKIIYTTLNFLEENFPESGISQISVKLKPDTNEKEIISKLKNRLKIDVYSWKDLYPSLIEALKIEKYAVFFIFILLIILATINVISLIFMIITYKKRDLFIFATLGMQNNNIRKIFLFFGSFIFLPATILGLIFAYLVGLLLQTFPIIKLPDVYYSSYLPILMELKIFMLIFFIVVIIGLISCIIATKSINLKNLADKLKNET